MVGTSSHVLQGALTLFMLLMGTLIAWGALGALRWEIFVKDRGARSARMLRIVLAMILGSALSGFVAQYISATNALRG
ncbi:DUF1146 domain-containing protein [Ferroacidibacillus organovorans]|uniref:DUF1146 domain-containing protein n=1 Tax=Ferroacidibacillus organovorans TaxID=1765683 RepID=A0A168C204_9BACL|nr:DUF1146 domain-containing protein [Ferroacidibacillus organovorans]KYP81477.1 hypothetical protein AYJ22_07600 [Ferroacidibacillus organovorans]OAG93980.1 hypothetical protein AYW79_07570 [Ferroacidibacillus organovorans]OPG16709.1 hypothetical protein B2M26_04930 [Ferroacidibacillus organovorans]